MREVFSGAILVALEPISYCVAKVCSYARGVLVMRIMRAARISGGSYDAAGLPVALD
jgi:hypothetical protein